MSSANRLRRPSRAVDVPERASRGSGTPQKLMPGASVLSRELGPSEYVLSATPEVPSGTLESYDASGRVRTVTLPTVYYPGVTTSTQASRIGHRRRIADDLRRHHRPGDTCHDGHREARVERGAGVAPARVDRAERRPPQCRAQPARGCRRVRGRPRHCRTPPDHRLDDQRAGLALRGLRRRRD